MLTVEDAARHFALKPDTVRRHIRRGRIEAVRFNRTYRIAWPAIWSCEEGPMPRGKRQERYKAPLLTKTALAGRLQVGTRTVDRWIADGLPTRNVFGSVRINPHDAEDWLRGQFAIEVELSLVEDA